MSENFDLFGADPGPDTGADPEPSTPAGPGEDRSRVHPEPMSRVSAKPHSHPKASVGQKTGTSRPSQEDAPPEDAPPEDASSEDAPQEDASFEDATAEGPVGEDPQFDSVVETQEASEKKGARVWKVSQINRAVKILLHESFPQLWISGEVTNFTRTRAGHCYFTLKDEAAQLQCAMFRRDAVKLPMNPDEGMTLRVYGELTVYEARGSYQMVVNRVESEGSEGLWKLAFERVRKRLESEGLMEASRKRPLPRFPKRVGVVTSPTGAAFRDIVSVIRRRAPWVRLVLRGARVQGGEAAGEIARAIDVMAASGNVDVIIVGRGGGSIEDLWGFNEEVVARAIAECPIPVVSAVGHETDVTISDLVADLRAPTPSAAAEAAVPERAQVQEALGAVQRRLGKGLSGQVERRRWRLTRGREALERGGRGLTQRSRMRRDRLYDRLGRRVGQVLQARRGRLAELGAAMEALSPLSTLARGYAVPLDTEGHVLRRVDEFPPGRTFLLRVYDGKVSCSVESEGQDLLEQE